jgi:prolyl oligopeptidase
MNNKKLSLSLAVISGLFLAGCGQQSTTVNNSAETEMKMEKVTYPVTQKGDVVDEYFGTQVPDPYRWLEDDMSAETADWVKAQNVTTQSYLNKIPYREKIEKRLSALLDYEKVGTPFVEGDYSYF